MDLESGSSGSVPPAPQNYDNLTEPESMGGPAGRQTPIPPLPSSRPLQTGPVAGAPVMPPAPPAAQPPIIPPASAPPPTPNIPSVTAGSNLKSYLMVGFLILLLLAAIGVFASWNGWIPIGASLWGKNKTTPSPTLTAEVSSSPVASNDSIRKQDLAKIAAALKNYYADTSTYPVSASIIKTSDPQSVLAQALVPTYIDALPDDPSAPTGFYGYKSDGKTFELTAALDDQSDTTGVIEGTLNIYRLTELSGQ